jgi:hypothetical protein
MVLEGDRAFDDPSIPLANPTSVQMNIKFPFAELTPEQSSINISDYAAEEISAAHIGKWQYPLIIRLETLADKTPMVTSNSLNDRAAGDALVPWVQSQTTYVVLGETGPDADDDSKIVRQRIYVHGQFYLLQVSATRPNALPHLDDAIAQAWTYLSKFRSKVYLIHGSVYHCMRCRVGNLRHCGGQPGGKQRR